MFPLITTMEADLSARQAADRRPNRTPNRLDYQRQLLEHKKMQTVDLHSLYIDTSSLNTRLERQRQIIENIDVQPSLLDRIRNRFGHTLIAAGERIRPDVVVNERVANA